MITRAGDPDVWYAYDVFALKAAHPLVDYLAEECEEPLLHGTRVWQSGWLAIDWLQRHPLPQVSKVIDVGCGWGLLGIYCARQFGSRVLSVDVDPCVGPFLDLHARINEVTVRPRYTGIAGIGARDLAGTELLAGADICFWNELVQPLYDLVGRALEAGVPRILVADPGREPFEKLAARCVRDFGAVVFDHGAPRPRSKGRLLWLDRTV